MSSLKTKKKIDREADFFGERQVGAARKTALVRGVFESVAPRYDLMNDLMSGGIHRLWKRRFLAGVQLRSGETALDLAGGTGDIALGLQKRAPGARITLCDINEAMVRTGKARHFDHGQRGLNYLIGNAESLPAKANSFDVVTISFGLRNVTHIDKALADIHRVLKPGGRFYCLEFSRVMKPLQPLYDLYSFAVLPRLGRYVAQDEESYRYLAESIRRFPPQEELAARMKKVGFGDVAWVDLSGGIAAIHSGVKKGRAK